MNFDAKKTHEKIRTCHSVNESGREIIVLKDYVIKKIFKKK